MTGPHRRAEILDALRRGTVPRDGLAAFAVGMERFEGAIDADLAAVALGRSGFKAVRGEYGSGKTFFVRWVQGAVPAERIEHWLAAAGFVDVRVTLKPESRELIKDWAPGRNLEDHIVSAMVNGSL
jgi:hypothetical protein